MRRERTGGTGLIVHGWYNRVRGWSSAFGWNAIAVHVDGEPRTTIYQVNPGPTWLDLDSGLHVVEFVGASAPLRTEWIELEPGQAVMIAFKAKERLPFRRATRDQWAVRQVW